MSEEKITLQELLPNEFYINKEDIMVAEISLKQINQIADILTNYYKENERLNNIINEINSIVEYWGYDEEHNDIINEINSIVEYWGYDEEHNDISSFRMAMKNIKDVLGSDEE